MPKVLIAEDNLTIADLAAEVLTDHGYDVCGIATTVDGAVSLARLHQPDLMLLDLRLAGGGLGSEVAAQLGPIDGTGILYATGSMGEVTLTADDGHACLLKPYGPRDLLRGLELVADLVATGHAPQPYPSGFQLLDATSAPNETLQDL